MKKPLLFLAVAAALYLGFIVARSHLQSIQGNSQQNSTAPAATPSAPPSGTNSLALATPFSDEVSAAERPLSITLLKPQSIRFKKGGKFLVKSSAPLFYRQEYLGDAAPGQQLQILDYNPETRRVYLWWNNPDGNPIAVNTLDLHGACKDIETVPANTVVAFKSISDGNALVEYNGDRFFVPVGDTDLVDRATQWRGQNELTTARKGALIGKVISVPSPTPTVARVGELGLPAKAAATTTNLTVASINPSSQAEQIPGDFSRYSRFIVTIEGDEGIGTGFLVRWGQWNAVATNAHVLSGNKTIKITTLDGRVLRTKRLAVAKNIDLALIEVDYNGPFLPVSSSFATNVHLNDQILVLGNSEGAGVVTNLTGCVKGIGPDRIEVDAQFVEGNSGSPVIHVKSGEAIGIATYYEIANIDEFADKSAAVKNSPFWTIRRFAFRLDAAEGFDFIPLEKFSSEAARISQFDETTENIYLLAADLAFNDTIHMDWHHRRLNRLAIPVQEYVQKTRGTHKNDHDSMDPRQEFLTRLEFECTADINLYSKDFVSSYHIEKLNEIIEERRQLEHQIERLLTQ